MKRDCYTASSAGSFPNIIRPGERAISTAVPRIAPAVGRKLGYYVYLYVDPTDGSVFYVGKGKNGRALAHLRADERKAITKRIRKIRASRQEPRIEILAHDLGSAEAALKVEAAAIDLLGISNLANVVRGHGVKFGRLPLEEAVAHYTKRKANIREAAMLVRINKAYRYGLSDVELYDATRSAWRVGENRDRVDYALAVFEGVVREVYRITGWVAAGSTFNVRRNGKAVVGMKIFGAGKLVKPEEKDASLKHVFSHGLVDAVTIGMLKPSEVDDTLKHMAQAGA